MLSSLLSLLLKVSLTANLLVHIAPISQEDRSTLVSLQAIPPTSAVAESRTKGTIRDIDDTLLELHIAFAVLHADPTASDTDYQRC